MVQVLSGICWAAYELGTLLMCFEAVDRRQRIGMLTLYNLGLRRRRSPERSAAARFWRFAGNHGGYLAIFGLSAIARLTTVPLLMRIGAAEQEKAGGKRPTTASTANRRPTRKSRNPSASYSASHRRDPAVRATSKSSLRATWHSYGR